MGNPFTAANKERKSRTKWWREHIPLAYAAVATTFVLLYVFFDFIDGRLPNWLQAIGISPSGIELILGAIYCGLGVWGLRNQRGSAGTGNGAWTVIYLLCLFGGILSLAKAFAFV